MKRLAVTGLILGLITLQAQAQTTKKGTKSNDGWGSSSNEWGGGGWDTPAPKKKTAAPAPKKSAVPVADAAPVADPKAEPAAAPAPTQATDAAATAAGGFGGGGSAADARPIQGISVAPGSALRPMSRTRYDYRGRLIESKPSMRPRE